LAFCIDSVAPKHVIVAGEFAHSLSSADSYRKTTPRIWLHGEANHPQRHHPRLDQAIDAFDGATLAAAERPHLTIEDKALFIFASGTTGLPKAANINHFRLMLASNAFAGVMNTGPDDCMYDCLPMYHTSGGVLAIGAALIGGGTVFIREKFSAREFWD